MDLLQFAKNTGCSCKIAPAALQEILQHQLSSPTLSDKLLVGNDTSDDAAVYALDNEQCLISTTDFFTPIVNDAFTFGAIAAANAISDVYAMGGKPFLANAILGWPLEKIPAAVANEVIAGARSVCQEAGVILAGGHSIDIQEPIFGLQVNGLVNRQHIKTNHTASIGDLIFITKPIGVGMLTTAEKREAILEEHKGIAAKQMQQLNKIGEALGKCDFVTALTDVTGFGLAGHLIEMCGNDKSVQLHWSKIPLVGDLSHYIKNRILPDATFRNWNGYGTKIGFETGVPVMDAFNILPDPQTSGGLLIAVKPNAVAELVALLNEYQIPFIEPIGVFVELGEKAITVAV